MGCSSGERTRFHSPPTRNRWITRILGYDSLLDLHGRVADDRFVVIRAGRPKGPRVENASWSNAPDTMSVMENPGSFRDNMNLLAPINIPFGRGTGCRFGEPRPPLPYPSLSSRFTIHLN